MCECVASSWLQTTCEAFYILYWRFYLLDLIFRSQDAWSHFDALSSYQIRRLPPIPFDNLEGLSLLVIICAEWCQILKLVWKWLDLMFSLKFSNVFCDTNLARTLEHQNWHDVPNLHIIYYVKVLMVTFWYFHSAHTNNTIVNHFIKVGIIFFSPINILTIINTTILHAQKQHLYYCTQVTQNNNAPW